MRNPRKIYTSTSCKICCTIWTLVMSFYDFVKLKKFRRSMGCLRLSQSRIWSFCHLAHTLNLVWLIVFFLKKIINKIFNHHLILYIYHIIIQSFTSKTSKTCNTNRPFDTIYARIRSKPVAISICHFWSTEKLIHGPNYCMFYVPDVYCNCINRIG